MYLHNGTLYVLHYHGFDGFRGTNLGSEARFAYKEPTAGTSVVEETMADKGWKLVFPMNQ